MAASADTHFMAILPRSCRLMAGERSQPGLEHRHNRV
jgi:hypothetical protein